MTLPTLAPFTIRHFRGDADFPLMLDIINRCKQAIGVERADTLEDIRNGYAHMVNCNPATDVLLVTVGNAPVAYSRHEWNLYNEAWYSYFSFGFVVPAWQRKGLGTILQQWHETQLAQIAATHQSALPKYYASYAQEKDAGANAMLRASGYVPQRFFFTMERDLSQPIPELPIAPQFDVRPGQPSEYRTIWHADDEAFQEHYEYRPGTEADYQEMLNSPHFNPTLWQVAWDGDAVAGAVLNYIDADFNAEYNRKIGWTDPIFVRKPWRKQGLAKALIARSLKMLRDECGLTHARLEVDAENENGALQLYQGLGFKQIKKTLAYRKPLTAAHS